MGAALDCMRQAPAAVVSTRPTAPAKQARTFRTKHVQTSSRPHTHYPNKLSSSSLSATACHAGHSHARQRARAAEPRQPTRRRARAPVRSPAAQNAFQRAQTKRCVSLAYATDGSYNHARTPCTVLGAQAAASRSHNDAEARTEDGACAACLLRCASDCRLLTCARAYRAPRWQHDLFEGTSAYSLFDGTPLTLALLRRRPFIRTRQSDQRAARGPALEAAAPPRCRRRPAVDAARQRSSSRAPCWPRCRAWLACKGVARSSSATRRFFAHSACAAALAGPAAVPARVRGGAG